MKTVPAFSGRDEIEEAYKWDLSGIYAGTEEFSADYEQTVSRLPLLEGYKGRLGEGSAAVLECLELYEDLMAAAENLYVYAKMTRDEDTRLAGPQELGDKADLLQVRVSTSASYIVPELTSLESGKLKSYIASPKLRPFRHFLKNIERQKAHILSEAEERIISMSGEVLSAPGEIFTMFDNADIRFSKIRGEDGKKTPLTKGNYISFLQSRKRDVRKGAYQEMYKRYGAFENTLARTFASNVKADKLVADLRGYGSSLEAALDSDNILPEVYRNLIAAVDARQPLMDRYLKLRKKLLGVKTLRMYDVYAPLIDMPDKKYTYEDSLRTISTGLAPLGEEYISALEAAFSSRWIDVYETQGKKSGAYSWGSYRSHPFVLLNYQGTIKDVFTVAHEMGHALHSYYSNKTQRYFNSGYPIFLAEVASTTNEILLADDLIRKSADKTEKAYLLNHYLEEFRTTVFRQTMFAEFELLTHEAVEKGEALTTDKLKRIYSSLVEKHFGNVAEVDDLIASEWSRIPHFYSSFYVYKYATGFCAAAAIAARILDGKAGARDSYLEFLSSGGSDYPLTLLKKAGVDLSTTKPVEAALDIFEKSLNELEALV